MKYKGYTGLVELEEGSDVLFGRVIGLRDVITFQGESVAEVTQAFHDSVDDYLEFCAARGEGPEKPYSGQFVLRIDPRLHRELANAAEEVATSLNAFIESVLTRHAPVPEVVGQSGGNKSKRGRIRSARVKKK
jgi:predicted HicB family RNase H-like nuclease